jgi:hypothetical protein
LKASHRVGRVDRGGRDCDLTRIDA